MEKYILEKTEHNTWRIEIEANSEEEAIAQAEKLWEQNCDSAMFDYNSWDEGFKVEGR